MSKNKITKNYIYNLIYQILLVISPLITMPFLSRSLGVVGIGEYSYAYSIVSYFVIFATFGFDVYGRREISFYIDDKSKLAQKFWSIQIIKTIFTLFTIIVYLIFCKFNSNETILLLLIFHLLNVPLNIGWFYQGIEEFKKITIRGFFLKLIDLLFVILFIHKPEDLYLYTLGSSMIAFITFAVLWFDLGKYVSKSKIDFSQIKYDLKNGSIFFLPAIATSIYTLLDKTMLGNITGSFIENGYYEQAQKINIVLLKVVLALGVVLLPQIVAAHKKNENEKVKEFIEKSSTYVFCVSIAMAFGLMCISDSFVPWFFGPDFAKVSILLKLSGFILIFQGLDDVFGMQYLVSVGKQKIYVISLFIGAGINFILNIFLIKYYSSVGAIIASFIGEISIVIFQMLFIRKNLDLKKIFKNSIKYFCAGLCMYLCCYLTTSNLPDNYFTSIIIFIECVLVYFVMLIILKDKLVLDSIKKINLYLKKMIKS